MAATNVQTSGPPFPLGKRVLKPWTETALARIGEQRFILTWIRSQRAENDPIDPGAEQTIEDHWEAAASATQRRSRRGAVVERVTSHLDAVETDLLRLAPAYYVFGQLPGLLALIKPQLPAGDARVARIEQLVENPPNPHLTAFERDLVVAAHHDARAAARQQVTRLRSFKTLLYGTAVALAVGASGLAAFGIFAPEKLPVCFSPENNIVCPTSTNPIPSKLLPPNPTTARGQPSQAAPAVIDGQMREHAGRWDILLLEGVGLLAAAVAGAASLRSIRGTSVPFSVPVATAVLKLPTGMLTAVLGLLLMRGEFVPGLSALDSPGQIVAWAILLGYSQQLLTRFVDRHAQTVLDNVGRRDPAEQQGDAPATATT
jgi:hypothetical protein